MIADFEFTKETPWAGSELSLSRSLVDCLSSSLSSEVELLLEASGLVLALMWRCVWRDVGGERAGFSSVEEVVWGVASAVVHVRVEVPPRGAHVLVPVIVVAICDIAKGVFHGLDVALGLAVRPRGPEWCFDRTSAKVLEGFLYHLIHELSSVIHDERADRAVSEDDLFDENLRDRCRIFVVESKDVGVFCECIDYNEHVLVAELGFGELSDEIDMYTLVRA